MLCYNIEAFLKFSVYCRCSSHTFSAGVGRTGTYITLDNVLDQIDTEHQVDIDRIIVKTRNQRMKMVQTKVVYIEICLSFCLLTKNDSPVYYLL